MKKIYYTLLVLLFLVPLMTNAETKKLYDVFKEEAESGSGLVHEYTGEHKDSFSETGTEKIYHWYAENETIAYTILDKWNVTFGGFCWQAYRTTDTGGVKLIYNGVPGNIYNRIPLNRSDYTIVTNTGNFTWNSTTSTWDTTITDNQAKEISFTVPTGDDYIMIQTGTSGSSTGGNYAFYKDGIGVMEYGSGGGMEMNLTYDYEALTSSNVIKMTYTGSSSVESPITFQIKMTKKGDLLGTGCDRRGVFQQIGTSSFNTNSNSLAFAGYMIPNSSKIKTYTESAAESGSLFGTDVNYSGGTYTLTNTSTTYDTTHHYTCNNTTGTCPTVRYHYYNDYYVELNGEENIEEAVHNMLDSDDVNETDSAIKTTIDTWFQNNMTDYTSKLEDTIFCNDRSTTNYSESGWNPNGGIKNNTLEFKNYRQNNIDLSCTNVTDQYSISNPKAQLTYPVGLMTVGEAILLKNDILRGTGTYYWLASPKHYGFSSNSEDTYVSPHGYTSGGSVDSTYGVRPTISLASSIMVISGDGSKLNPYVADWIYNDIEIIDNEKGYIEIVDLENILEGSEVVFHVIPIDGMIGIKILDAEGNEIEYESTGNENEYKFIMPNSIVTIKPIYKEKLPDIVNPQTGTLLFFALIIVMLLEIGTYQLIKIKKKRMKEFE